MKPIWRVTADGKNFVGTGRFKHDCICKETYPHPRDGQLFLALMNGYDTVKCLNCEEIRAQPMSLPLIRSAEPKKTIFQKIARWFE